VRDRPRRGTRDETTGRLQPTSATGGPGNLGFQTRRQQRLLPDCRPVRPDPAGARAVSVECQPEKRLRQTDLFQEVSDEQLMASALRGSMPAFEDLYRRYAHRILRFTNRLVRDHQEAESITQEAFLRLLQNSATYDGSRRFSTWMYTIARNLCLDELARRRPEAERRTTFMLREGSLCVEATHSKQGCCVKTPVGTVRCGKGKTLIRVTSPRECTVTPLEGQVEVECGGHAKVVLPGVCAELKRSKPCCYRPARPKETRCDWVDRCGKPNDGWKK